MDQNDSEWSGANDLLPTTHTKSRWQKEIDWLRERQLLKKQEEKEGINLLQEKIMFRLSTLRGAENLLRKRRGMEQMRSSYFTEACKFAESLHKGKSGSLLASKAILEEHLKRSCTDDQCQEVVSFPPDMPPLNTPEYELGASPPRWIEVDKIVHRARTHQLQAPTESGSTKMPHMSCSSFGN